MTEPTSDPAAGGLRDFAEFIDPPLRLPIGGKVYTIPPIDIETGMLLRKAVTDQLPGAIRKLEAGGDEGFARRILGTAYDEMVADRVPDRALDRVLLTALTDHKQGRMVAEVVWQVGQDPKVIPAILAASARIVTESVDEANGQPKRSAGSTTSTNPAVIRRKPKAKRSPGARSRKGGR